MRRRRVKVALPAHNFDRAEPSLRRPPDLIRGDEAIQRRSAARGEMSTRKLIAFDSSTLGNAPAHELFERVKIDRMLDGQLCPIKRLDNLPPARRYADYQVTMDRNDMPEGVTIRELV
jgi:hypothetical protein